MTPCPFGDKLADLLANHLSAPEQDELVEHVEGCPSCRERLGGLTALPDDAMWRTEGPPSGSDAEDEMMRRLKLMAADSHLTFVEQGPTPIDPTRTFPNEPGFFDPPTVTGYEILEEVGRGGMGVVYKARQVGLRRIVALKMVRTETKTPADDLARFRAEAATIARLRHPNIVQIHDTGEVDGRPYLVLEFVPGGSLAQHLQGRPQPLRPAAQLIETLARAVHVAHENGVIHRDLKPGNILLERPGSGSTDGLSDLVPKITDFGVAKCVEREWETSAPCRPTPRGEIVGTPNYMAPEQAQVPRPTSIGPTADVYSLGAILYELLTGRPPFTGESPLSTILQVLGKEPVVVSSLRPNVPRDLETICLKCLRKDPRKRYESALDLADDLQRFLRDEPIRARPVGTVEKAWRSARRHPLATGLLAAGLLAPIVALATLSHLSARLVRSSALESAAQQAELLEEANKEYSRIVQLVEEADFEVNRMVPPTPGTVPLSVPATFLHDVGAHLSESSKSGVRVRQFSDHPFPWRKDGGPHDDFEREALRELRDNMGTAPVHRFEDMDGQPVVRYAQARIMQESCVKCHNTHPESQKRDWQVGDVRGVLEIIRPLDKDEARIGDALRLALLLSAIVSGLLLAGSLSAMWLGRGRVRS